MSKDHPALVIAVASAILTLASTPGEAAAPPTPVEPFACSTARLMDLVKAMPAAGARPLIPPNVAMPEGDEGTFGIAGPFGPQGGAAEPTFRIFVAPGTLRLDDDRRAVNLDQAGAQRVQEVHALTTEHAAAASPDGTTLKDGYRVSFMTPAYPGAGPLDLVRDRSVLVAVCGGDKLQAWALRPLPFANRGAAQLRALACIVAVYLLAAIAVYLRRRQLAKESAAANSQVYRVATVKSWPLWRCLDPVAMTSDLFDQGSLPKFQILFFVLIVVFSLAYLVFWRGALTDLSETVVYLLGIPALGTLGAQITTVTRDRMSAENWAWLVNRGVLPINEVGAGDPPRWSDLVMSGSELDLTKMQALLFSFVVGYSMVDMGPSGLAKFAVPPALLSILGLSQVVFVGGRFTKPTTMADIDALVNRLKADEGVLLRAISSGLDVDDDGKPLSVAPTPFAVRPTDLATAKTQLPTAVRRYEGTARELRILLEALTHRAIDAAPLLQPRL